MDYCQNNGIGYIAWSWTGNGGDDFVLDLTSVNTFSKNDLSDWGKDVFFGENGIQKTSKKAYQKDDIEYEIQPDDEGTYLTFKLSDLEIFAPCRYS